MMSVQHKVLALSSLLIVGAAIPSAHAQDPQPEAAEPTDPIGVRLEIETATLSETAQADIADEVQRQFAPLAHEYGLHETEDAELVLRLEFGEVDKSAGVYVIHSEATYQGEALPRDEPRTCVRCTPADLVADGLRIVQPAAQEVVERRQAAAARSEEMAAEDSREVDGPPQSDAGQDSRSRMLGPAGYVGIASSVLGLGGAIAGAVMLDRGIVRESYGGLYLDVTDYRTPGAATFGTSLGLMVAGTVLLAVDLTVLARRRQARARASLDGVALSVSTTPGIVVHGRF